MAISNRILRSFILTDHLWQKDKVQTSWKYFILLSCKAYLLRASQGALPVPVTTAICCCRNSRDGNLRSVQWWPTQCREARGGHQVAKRFSLFSRQMQSILKNQAQQQRDMVFYMDATHFAYASWDQKSCPWHFSVRWMPTEKTSQSLWRLVVESKGLRFYFIFCHCAAQKGQA